MIGYSDYDPIDELIKEDSQVQDPYQFAMQIENNIKRMNREKSTDLQS